MSNSWPHRPGVENNDYFHGGVNSNEGDDYMNEKSLISFTNKIAIAFVILLIYWVSVFIAVSVFDLKVFRENMTAMFGLSIMGIIAVLSGCAVINIMLNLSIIAKSKEKEIVSQRKSSLRAAITFLLPLVFLIGVLFLGDKLSSNKKERIFKNTAESILNENKVRIEKLVYSKIDSSYISESKEIIKVLEKSDELIPQVSIIFKDSISGQKVYVEINSRIDGDDKKSDLVFQTNTELRKYLTSVFDQGKTDPFFKRKESRFKYYYPITLKNKTAILMFNEYSRYGKFGS